MMPRLPPPQPDLILTQELCKVCAVSYREVNEVARAIDAEITVVSLEPTSIEGILNTISTVGAMTESEDAAVDLVESLRERLGAIEEKVQARREAAVGRRGWSDSNGSTRRSPSGHWVPEQIRRAGGWELLGADGDRSVQTTWDAVAEVDPEMLLLMPCGFHLRETLDEWARCRRPPGYDDLTAVRRGQVFALDGSAYFSRPGPRVFDGIELLAEIFDPEAFVDIAPMGSWTPVGP